MWQLMQTTDVCYWLSVVHCPHYTVGSLKKPPDHYCSLFFICMFYTVRLYPAASETHEKSITLNGIWSDQEKCKLKMLHRVEDLIDYDWPTFNVNSHRVKYIPVAVFNFPRWQPPFKSLFPITQLPWKHQQLPGSLLKIPKWRAWILENSSERTSSASDAWLKRGMTHITILYICLP